MGRERRTYSPELPVRFKDVLLPDAQKFYDWVLTPQLQYQYENALHGVKRMKGIRDKGFPLPEGFSESNQEHVVDAMRMAREYSLGYPDISRAIRFGRVQILLGVHDSGELAEKVGDVQPTNRSRRDEARKRLEPIAARKAVISQVPNSHAKTEVQKHYSRYQLNNPYDLEVQMARFIDKAQGTTRVAHIAFNAENVTDDTTLNRMRLHLWETVPRMMEPASHLLVGLLTREARENMRQILMNELGLLEKYGPSEVARAYMRGVAA